MLMFINYLKYYDKYIDIYQQNFEIIILIKVMTYSKIMEKMTSKYIN